MRLWKDLDLNGERGDESKDRQRPSRLVGDAEDKSVCFLGWTSPGGQGLGQEGGRQA